MLEKLFSALSSREPPLSCLLPLASCNCPRRRLKAERRHRCCPEVAMKSSPEKWCCKVVERNDERILTLFIGPTAATRAATTTTTAATATTGTKFYRPTFRTFRLSSRVCVCLLRFHKFWRNISYKTRMLASLCCHCSGCCYCLMMLLLLLLQHVYIWKLEASSSRL